MNGGGLGANYGASGQTQYNSGQYNGYGGNNYGGSGYSGPGYNNSGYGNSNFGANTQQNYGQRDFGQGAFGQNNNRAASSGINPRSDGWAFGSTGTTPRAGNNTSQPSSVGNSYGASGSNFGMDGRNVVGVTRGYQSGTTPSLGGSSRSAQSYGNAQGTTRYQSGSPWATGQSSGFRYGASYGPYGSTSQQSNDASTLGRSNANGAVQNQGSFDRGPQSQNSTNAPRSGSSLGTSSQFNNAQGGLNSQGGATTTTPGELDEFEND
jgi:hypothetical protein